MQKQRGHMLHHFAKALTLSTAAFLALASLGCSQAGTPAPGGPPPAASNESGPVTPKVNRVTLALGPPSTEANAPNQLSGTITWQIRPMYEYLTGVNLAGKELQPMLATEWKLQPDGQSFRFQLRKGVKFQFDKGEFTAKDVAYTLKDLSLDGALPTTATRWNGLVKSIDPVGDYEVVVNLKQPDQAFLWTLGQQEGGFEIRSEADSKAKPPTFQERPIAGTGPYYLSEREQGRYIRYARVGFDHWRQKPEFPEFEFRFMKENSTILAALLAKEVQMAALPFDLIDQAEKAGFKSIRGRAPVGVQTFVSLLGPWVNKAVNPGERLNPDPNAKYVFPDSPLVDVRVRKALSKAINRDELNKAFFKGYGAPIVNLFFHPSRPGWNPDWERRFQDEYGYDPEGAKRLLAEAGYGPNTPLKHTAILGNSGYFAEGMDLFEAITSYWRKVGVDVKLEQMDANTRTTRGRELSLDNYSNLNATSIRQFYGFGVYGGGSSLGSRGGNEIWEAVDYFNNKMRPLTDASKFETAWRELGDLAFNLHTAPIPLFWLPAIAVVDPNIVADYPFSGSLTGAYADVEYIKAAR